MRVMISCGEPSGDLYAGALASQILQLDPSAVITGFGGDRLAAAGATLVENFSGLSVTGLLMQQRYGGEAGEPATEERFTDYRSVQGLQVAHRATLKRENNPPFERILRTFEINVPIEPTFFKKPAAKR